MRFRSKTTVPPELGEQLAFQTGRIQWLEDRVALHEKNHVERLPQLAAARRVPELEARIRVLTSILRDRAEAAIREYPGKVQPQIRADLETLDHSTDVSDRTAAHASLLHHSKSRPAAGLLDLVAAITGQEPNAHRGP